MLAGKPKPIDGYEKYFQDIFTEVSASLEEKVRMFDVQYPESFERRTKIHGDASEQERQYRKIFLDHLGNQLKRIDIPCE